MLCRTPRSTLFPYTTLFRSKGYYVLLLAEARGHLAIPTVKNIVDLKALKLVRIVSDEFDDVIQQSLKNIKSQEFTLSIYFGQRSEEHTFELQSRPHLVCRLL